MSAEFASLLSTYGYAGTFAGVLLEGETFLVLSGVAANRGYLDARTLIAIGAIGAFATDNFFFAVGRYLGPAFSGRFPRLTRSAAHANGFIARVPISAVIGIRFLYGMRSVGPAIIGAGRLPWSRFVILDVIASALWSCCWVGAGYLLGEAGARLFGGPGWVSAALVAGLAFAAIMIALLIYRRRRIRTADASGFNGTVDKRQP